VRNAQHKQMSSALPPRTDVGLSRAKKQCVLCEPCTHYP
jgi:hypothetical protein